MDLKFREFLRILFSLWSRNQGHSLITRRVVLEKIWKEWGRFEIITLKSRRALIRETTDFYAILWVILLLTANNFSRAAINSPVTALKEMKRDKFRIGVLPHTCTGQARTGKNWNNWCEKVGVMNHCI